MGPPKENSTQRKAHITLPLVPDFCTVKGDWVEMKNFLAFLEERRADPPSMSVIETYSTDAIQEGYRYCGLKLQLAPRYEVPRKHEGFIRNRKAHNPQRVQSE